MNKKIPRVEQYSEAGYEQLLHCVLRPCFAFVATLDVVLLRIVPVSRINRVSKQPHAPLFVPCGGLMVQGAAGACTFNADPWFRLT